MTTQLSMHPKAVSSRRQRERERAGFVKPQPPIPCEFCHARDARDAAHARGCPDLQPGTTEELYALALTVQFGWAEARRQRELAVAARRSVAAVAAVAATG